MFGKTLLIPKNQARAFSTVHFRPLNLEKDPSLPASERNVFKKRATKLKYNKTDYFQHLLPSEKQHFFQGDFDIHNIFGKRMNTRHSPHIKAQIDLDDKLVLGWFIFVFVNLFIAIKQNKDVEALRTNHLNRDMGTITLENLI